MSEEQGSPPVSRARLTESEGCALLKARFESAGFTIAENEPFREHGVDVTLDGFDSSSAVGYEFITTAAGDREEFTPEVVAKLEGAMSQGKLFLLLIDEADVDADGLTQAAGLFLQRVRTLLDKAS